MLEPEFRCRETTDPPHGHRPVWPPRPPMPPMRPSIPATPPSWWARLWRRLRDLLGRPAPLRHADRRRRRRAAAAVGSLHCADIDRILAECCDREQGEEP